jgi:DNA-binding MarR family transcriptional regulator
MPTAEYPDTPLNRFAVSIFDMNGLLMRSGDRVTKAIGQSSARWQVLGRAGYRPHTVAQMARDMGHARQSVQRIADLLVEDGLAVFRDNPGDRRAKLLELTPRGAETLAAIYALDGAWSQKVLARLDPGELSGIAQALERIAGIFRSTLDAEAGSGAEAD